MCWTGLWKLRHSTCNKAGSLILAAMYRIAYLLAVVLLFFTRCHEVASSPGVLQAAVMPGPPKDDCFRIRHPQLLSGADGIVAIRQGHEVFQLRPGLADDIYPL